VGAGEPSETKLNGADEPSETKLNQRRESLALLGSNGRCRRNPAVAVRAGEGPFTTLLGHSAFAPETALPVPNPPLDRWLGEWASHAFAAVKGSRLKRVQNKVGTF
jgi:hypothetical protein